MYWTDFDLLIFVDGVKINQARVIVADQSVSNGVFHVIDSVLCPPEVCPSL